MKRLRLRWLLVGVAALVALLAVAVQAAEPPPGDPVKGKQAYEKGCALCHGVGGVGVVGPPFAGMAGHFERLMQIPGFSMEEGILKIRMGIPNRMPAFPPELLSDEDLGNMLAYLMTLPPTTGENLYENPSMCAACHGARAAGGVAARLSGAAARFAAQGLTKDQVLPGLIPLIRNGIPGKMPAFPELTDGEILSIGEYLWALPDPTWEDQFTSEHGRAPTAEDKVDREWSVSFLAANGRPPTEAEWRKHFQDIGRK